MPGFPGFDPLDPTAGKQRSTGFSVGMVSLLGETRNIRFSGLGGGFDVVIGDKMAVAEAAGALSNMGVYALTEDKKTVINTEDAAASDEAMAGPSDVLVFHFQNNDGVKYTVDVPAPDATLFAEDGITLKSRTDAVVGSIIGDFIDAAETAINTTWVPNNSFSYQRGVLASRKVARSSKRVARPSVAEGAGDTAGPAV